jgi:hypothetical protein
MAVCPTGIAAGAFVIVAGFRTHNTQIALCQGLETRETISLGKAFAGLATTGDTMDFSRKYKLQFLAKNTINGKLCIPHGQPVTDRVGCLYSHFSKNP